MKRIITILTFSAMAHFTYGQLIITGGSDTYRFSNDTIKISGDSTFVTVKQFKHEKLIHEEDQIFVYSNADQKRNLTSVIFHGNSTQWYESGQKKCNGQFHYGQKTGDWKYWDKDGHEIKEEDLYPRRNADYYIDGVKVKSTDSK